MTNTEPRQSRNVGTRAKVLGVALIALVGVVALTAFETLVEGRPLADAAMRSALTLAVMLAVIIVAGLMISWFSRRGAKR